MIGITATMSANPVYSNAFANCANGSFLTVQTVTFTGTATGVKYTITNNGVIYTNTGDTSYLPGNTSGTISTGGQYS